MKTPKGRYKRYRNSASGRGIDFKITLDDFMRLTTNTKCSYCGQVFDMLGIDRLDSTLGYVDFNVTSCCSVCNYMKRDYLVEDFISQCIRIAKNFEGKKK